MDDMRFKCGPGRRRLMRVKTGEIVWVIQPSYVFTAVATSCSEGRTEWGRSILVMIPIH